MQPDTTECLIPEPQLSVYMCTFHVQVTPESLQLHYFSNRPGLWPIVVGVLKGLSNDYFKLDLQVSRALEVYMFLLSFVGFCVDISCIGLQQTPKPVWMILAPRNKVHAVWVCVCRWS